MQKKQEIDHQYAREVEFAKVISAPYHCNKC